MPLRILHRLPSTKPVVVNYPFHELLAALDLLGAEDRTWLVSDSLVTWPDELLDGKNKLIPGPRIRFSADHSTFACTQDFFLLIAHGVEGDWTQICATGTPLDQLPPQDPSDITDLSFDFRFRCIDAAFWAVESRRADLKDRLQAHGFVTEPCEDTW